LSENKNTDLDVIVCRCEEITKREIIEAIKEGYTTIGDIKRRTRSGMGFCQGRTCTKLIQKIIEQETGKKSDIIPSTYRAPVRPIEVKVFLEGADEI
jgi:NAD(P)H-nitrite reductase large subunit